MQQNNELTKTCTFLLVAGMALLVAWEPWRAAPVGADAAQEVGAKLFPEFKDPLAAKSLEIVKYDEDTAAISDFKVAQTNGVWSIPSHSNYPADAREHMAQAATVLVDLDILNVASSSPGDQELYGVITPDPAKLKPGMVGVGTRVTLKDGKDKVLADLVIGKEVKDQPAQRYVRTADRDQIYKVAVKTDKLSTKFEDWIEKDLLKLNAFDVREVELNNYRTQEGQRPDGSIGLAVIQNSRFKLGFDDSKSSWNLIEMAEYDQKGQAVPSSLGEDEELNNEKLNALKTALDELLIVDVERKPEGLSQDLRASDDFVKNREAVQSLAERGFYPASRRGGELEVFSSEGEVTCTTKEGVRYVLRFGRAAGSSASAGEDGKPKNEGPNRYLFVMAQLDENQIPKPQLQTVPGEAAADEAAAAEKPADEAAAKPDDAQPAEEKAGDEKAADEKADETVPEKKTADDEEAAPSEPAAEPAAAEAPAADAPKADAPAAAPTTEEEVQKLAVQKENKRKQDEYDSAIKKGQDKVKELNDRFADWYFIISNDVYKKIHLGRGDIVKEKEKAGADKTPVPNDLKDLQKGLEGLGK